MDPLSIATSSFAIAGAVAKAIIAVAQFSHEAKAAAEDLEAVSRELHALSSILHPLTRSLSGASDSTVPEAFREQLKSSLEGCSLVVSQIEDTVSKYQRDRAWTRTKWVMFGRGDMEKLRKSLEAYKMALGLGIHVISLAVGESIQKDTTELRNETHLLRLNTEEILARVNSLRHLGRRNSGGIQIKEWMEDIAILSSYAETTYQESVTGETAIGETDIGQTDISERDIDSVKARERIPRPVNDDKDVGDGIRVRPRRTRKQPTSPSEARETGRPRRKEIEAVPRRPTSPLIDPAGERKAVPPRQTRPVFDPLEAKEIVPSPPRRSEQKEQKERKYKSSKSRTRSSSNKHGDHIKSPRSRSNRNRESGVSAPDPGAVPSSFPLARHLMDRHPVASNRSPPSDKLLEAVDDAIRRLILPELEAQRRDSVVPTGTSAPREGLPSDRRKTSERMRDSAIVRAVGRSPGLVEAGELVLNAPEMVGVLVDEREACQ